MNDMNGPTLPDPGQAGHDRSVPPSEEDTGFEPVYSLDLNEVSGRFDAAQLPRSKRTLLRYCQYDKLDCTKVETMHGEQYFVSEPSVERLIAEILERERFTRPPQIATTTDIDHGTRQGSAGQTSVSLMQNQAGNLHLGMGEPGRTDQGEPGQVPEMAAAQERLLKQSERENDLLRDQLEKKDAQIENKDKQIDDLIERGREDKLLIQNFQRKLGMLDAPKRENRPPVADPDKNHLPWHQPPVDYPPDTLHDDMV